MGDPEIDIAGILDVLRRRASLIIAVFAVVLGGTIAVLQFMPPIYAATALVLVEPKRGSVLEPLDTWSNAASEHARIESEAEILRSDALLLKVVRAANLATRPEFADTPGWHQTAWAAVTGEQIAPNSAEAAVSDALAKLRSSTSISRRGLTHVVGIEVRSTDPALAAELANAFAHLHIESQVEAKVAASATAIAILRQRLGQLEPDQTAMPTPALAQIGASTNMVPALPVSENSERDRLLARASELETEARLHVADSRIVSPALEPTNPSDPQKLLVLAFGGAFGVLFGTSAALARETLVGGFSSETQAESVLRRRVTTCLPRLRIENPADLIVSSPQGPFSEAVRRIVIAMTEPPATPETPIRQASLVVVASSVPAEGKTVLAVSLARALAATGRQVLLIDCDLRHSRLRQLTRAKNGPGLGRFLEGARTGHLAVDPLLIRDPLSTVTIIHGDTLDETSSAGLLTSGVFRQIVNAAKSSFDVVVLDTPPISTSADALHLASQADNIVYAIATDRTRQIDVRRNLDRLSEIAPRAHIQLALNPVERRRA